MLLNRLRMKNFKRFRDQEIIFRDGITGIVGNNGTGKSSIVSAILFALYGLQGTGLDGSYIVSSFAGPQDACEVRLDFSVGGNEYTVVRRFKRRPSSTLHEANIYLNRKLLANTVQRVAVEVRRIVGMGPGDFRNTIYAGQKDLLSLLESRAGSRKDWFMQVLGIDYLKRDSMEELKARIDACETMHSNLHGRQEELNADGIRRQLDELRADLDAAVRRLQEIEEEHAAATMRRDEAKAERDRLLAVRERYVRLAGEEVVLSDELRRYEADCREIEEQIASIESLLGELEQVSGLSARYEELKGVVRDLGEKKSRAEQLALTCAGCREQLKQLEERRGRITSTLDALRQDEQRCRDLQGDLVRRREVQQRLEQLKSSESDYDRLKEELSRLDERFKSVERRVFENRREIEVLEARSRELATLEQEVAEYDELRRREEILAQAAVHARQRERCMQELEERLEQLNAFEIEIRTLSRQLTEMGAVEEQIAALERRKEELASRISACTARQQAVRDEAEGVAAHLAEIVGAGADGACPMCRQSLGDRYEDLVAELEDTAASLQRSLAAMEEEFSRATAEYQRLADELQHLHRQRLRYQQLKEQHALYVSRREDAAAVAEKWREELERHAAAMRALGVEHYDAHSHEALRERLRSLEERRAAADTLRGECGRLPSLRKERQNLIREVEEFLAQKEKLENALRTIDFDPAEMERLDAEKDRLETAYQEYVNARARLGQKPMYEEELRAVSGRIDAIQAQIRTIEAEREELGFDPGEYRLLLDEFGRAEEAHLRARELRIRLEEVPRLRDTLEAKREHVRQRKVDLLRIREAMEELGFDERQIAAADERLTERNDELQAVIERKSSLAARVQVCQSRIRSYEQALGRVDELVRQSEKISDEIELLKLTRRIVGDYIVHLLGVVRDQIEEEAGDVLAEITDGRYGTVMLDDDFNVLIHDMGEDYPADRFSGGEQDDIAIALRIALSRFLAEVNEIHDSTFLIFDEIFGSQDEERRNNLIRALRTQEAHFPQIFLISHITDVQDEFSTTLAVELGADQASRVQEIS